MECKVMDLVKKRSEENLYEAASDSRGNDNRERRKSNKESAGSACVAQRRPDFKQGDEVEILTDTIETYTHLALLRDMPSIRRA